ncbi:hypothetical protein D9757_014332 [Collybiopsis confluens]|uniref:laccase n=1 Tax=Collybiopsis confluens TaxID=2823264 RepID=A0A8H5D686_9AGAR|nr:hypothetical protein D9757_014332 [Collybiopsis confluens]
MLSVTSLLLLGPLGTALVAAIGPVTDLHIQNAFIQPDGFNRSGVLAEGVLPGPLITGTKVASNAIDQQHHVAEHLNSLARSLSKGHKLGRWCPIASGHSFLYDFNVPDQAGTFWYHSHLSSQYCDGLRGVFVVYDPEDLYAALYDVDNGKNSPVTNISVKGILPMSSQIYVASTIITLEDWYRKFGVFCSRLRMKFELYCRCPRSSFWTCPEARFSTHKRVRYPNQTTVSPLAVINVIQGKRYRFRLVSIACTPNYVFSVDNHSFTVIEADGDNHKPVVADSVQIFAGQRYSLVLNATQPTINNYWVRANPNVGPTGFEGGINSAILRYQGAPIDAEPPTVQSPLVNQLKETSLVPLTLPPVEDGTDRVDVDLVFGFSGGNFTINGHKFVPPTVPVLLQILSGAKDASELLPKGSFIPLELNKTVQITFNASAVAAIGAPHPIHLHGHNFDVIRSAGSNTSNYFNPPRRDVVSAGDSVTDNVIIRFRTDNPGPWFLHCHIDLHLVNGFAIVFAEDKFPNIISSNPVPDAWNQLCPIYNNLTAEQRGGL